MISIDLNRNWTSGSQQSSKCWTLQLFHAWHLISGYLSSSVKLHLLQTHFSFKCSLEGKQDEQFFPNKALSQKSSLTLINTPPPASDTADWWSFPTIPSYGVQWIHSHISISRWHSLAWASLGSHVAASCDMFVSPGHFSPERKFSNNRLPKKISLTGINLFPWIHPKQINSPSSR